MLNIDIDRLLDRLERMSQIGRYKETGVHRLTLSDEDRQARDLLMHWMNDARLKVRIDSIGNMYGYRRGKDGNRIVASGSHLDSVAHGGRFDGSLGVLSALEVVDTLNDHGMDTEATICMVNFTNEEGARFAPDMMGSMVVSGQLSIEDAWEAEDLKVHDVKLKSELERIGYLGEDDPLSFRPEAFVELHIEQGPVLENEGVQIGVVEKVQGIRWLEFKILGQSNHAGTTPMDLRRDAGLVAAQIASYCREVARSNPGVRATAGMLDLSPNLINVMAGKARLCIDLRCPEVSLWDDASKQIQQYAREKAAQEDVEVEVTTLTDVAPVKFDTRVVTAIQQSAQAAGYSYKQMISGAGHDAQLMARVVPSGMIFIPSENGISHDILEYSDPKDIQAGANILLNTICALAAEGK